MLADLLAVAGETDDHARATQIEGEAERRQLQFRLARRHQGSEIRPAMNLPKTVHCHNASLHRIIKAHTHRILLWGTGLSCLQLLAEPARTNLVVEYAPAVAQLSGKVAQEPFVNKGIKVQKLILKLNSPVNVVSDGTVKDFPNVPKANVAEVEISDATSGSLLTALKKCIGKNATLKGVLTHQLSNWQSKEIIFEPRQIVAGNAFSNQTSQNNQSIPAQFHGTWTWNKNGIHPENGEMPVKISAKEILGHESVGQVTRVTRSEEDKERCVVNIDAACEGMEGKETLILILSRDGRSLRIEQDNPTTCAFGPSVLYRVR